MDGRPEAGQKLDEMVVLALRDLQVHRVQEAVGRVVERPPEGRAGPLHEDLAERRRHALGAEAREPWARCRGGRVGHGAKDTSPARLVTEPA